MNDARRWLRGMVADLMGVPGEQKIIWTPSLPIIYIDNPKCGSGTIKQTLKQAQAAEYNRAGKAFERRGSPHQRDGLLKKQWLRRNARSHRFLISCVRHPFTRALSGYLDKVLPEENSRKYAELRSHNVENFEQHLRALVDFRPKRLNPHFRPQHINLNFPNMKYDAIFYLENLSALPRFFAGISPGLTLETFAPHGRSARSKLRDYYTDRAVTLVQEIYAQDFSLFGYSDNLDDVGVSPGECISGRKIVSDIEEVSDTASCRPARAASCRAFEATLCYNELMRIGII